MSTRNMLDNGRRLTGATRCLPGAISIQGRAQNLRALAESQVNVGLYFAREVLVDSSISVFGTQLAGAG